MRFLLLLLLGVSALAQSNKQFHLVFDYPVDPLMATNVDFRAHASQSLSINLTNWTVVESQWVRESTNAQIITFVSADFVAASPPMQFFVVSASNEWGLVFSDVLATAPPARTGTLRLR